jgi:hypothetical protein
MSRTIGGNPLRAAAIRMGRPHPAPTTPTPRPYTERDRAALLAPLNIGSFGGKSWGGVSHTKHDHIRPGQTGEGRYGWTGDWPDLDQLF